MLVTSELLIKTAEMEESMTKEEIAWVSVKIPPFRAEKPEIWFYHVEAQFSICRITAEETKFNYLVSQLEAKFVESLWDIISDNSKTKYTAAKECLLNTFKESQNKRLQRLLTGIDLGDSKPSQLFQKMQNLATDDISHKILKILFLQKMPDSERNILIISDEDIEKLALMADRIIKMQPKQELYCTSNIVSPGADAITELQQQIVALDNKLEKLSVTRNSHPRSRNSARSSND
ncbi:hypothetical protein X975_06334, partial [Stegodyphus mimosarum]